MKNKLLIYLIISTAIIVSTVFAKKNDSTLTSKNKVFVYPFLFYTPETEFALGGGGIFYFRSSNNQKEKPSAIVFTAYYTTNKQYLVSVNPQIYINSESYYLNTTFTFSKFVDSFNGIGSTSKEIENPEYLSKIAEYNIDFRKLLVYNLQIGIIYDSEYRTITDRKSNPFLLNNPILGSEGGFVSGAGLIFCYDSRDNVFYPTSGMFYEVSTVSYLRKLGSRYTFTSKKINLRNYLSFSDGVVLASQIYWELLSGSPPFYKLPRLGGDQMMRGYFNGRFRDKNYYTLQTELRTHIWANFGAVIFLCLGDVSPSFSSFKLVNVKSSFGFGMRYRFDKKEKLDVRADVGFGKSTGGIYFGIQQAF